MRRATRFLVVYRPGVGAFLRGGAFSRQESPIGDLLSKAQYLAIARILRPQGRRGEVAAEILTDFAERFQGLGRVFLRGPAQDEKQQAIAYQLESVWPHKGRMILKLAGVDSIEQAERLRGSEVLIPFEERVQLPAGHFYVFELIGCQVMERRPEGMACLGTVGGLQATGGVSLLEVEGPQGEVLIPFAEVICKKIDVAARRIEVELPGDLLELNATVPKPA